MKQSCGKEKYVFASLCCSLFAKMFFLYNGFDSKPTKNRTLRNFHLRGLKQRPQASIIFKKKGSRRSKKRSQNTGKKKLAISKMQKTQPVQFQEICNCSVMFATSPKMISLSARHQLFGCVCVEYFRHFITHICNNYLLRERVQKGEISRLYKVITFIFLELVGL